MSYAPILSEPTLAYRSYLQPKASIVSKPPSRKRARTLKRKVSTPRGNTPASGGLNPLIVHCHLCWDWVWQRPQQFVSRLSRQRKVLFVETVAPDDQLAAPLARFRTVDQFPNLTVLRLQFPTARWQDGRYVDRERRRLVQEFLSGQMAGQFKNPIQWFYDPMAITAFGGGRMEEALTVYDCMDELSKFRCAPPEIIKREAQLISQADVIFTGGWKLFKAKSKFHDNCHFFGCGVEWEHFGRALEPATPVPADLAALRKPVLGYFGVIDERMDYELVAALADANPEWSVAMIGPVLKVDEASLPRRANLHWLGRKGYEELPAYCKGLDACLMPFALNESTEFINPTKALEYMATGRPIVSTAVADVVRNFGSVVKIGRSPEEFIELCRQVLAKPDEEARERGLQMARENSWETIVERMEGHVAEALAKKAKSNGVNA
jgi:glycosyltransferase involved in cell wall biosynthesis